MMNPVKKYKALDPEFRAYVAVYAAAATAVAATVAGAAYGTVKVYQAVND